MLVPSHHAATVPAVVFVTPQVCSGTGDWVVAQAKEDEANWVASVWVQDGRRGETWSG